MGYLVATSIWADPEAEVLLSWLRTDPASVFEKPYGGYLLFLVGGAEKEILDWISKNVVLLDSLTGEDIAFALFVKNFTFELRVLQGNRDKPPARELFRLRNKQVAIPLEELKAASSINRLVKSGRCGWVVNKDRINAITYAVDDLARGFGVMRELPCIIVLDAIPQNHFEVFPLNQDNIRELITILRGVLDYLHKLPDYSKFMNTIYRIFHFQNEARDIRDGIVDLAKHRARIEQIPDRIREALLYANLRAVGSIAQGDWPDYLVPIIKTYVKEADSSARPNLAMLFRFARTRNRLNFYANNHSWPLVEPARSRLENIYNQYVCELLDAPPEYLDLESPKQCRELHEQLLALQLQLIDSIMISLPTTDTIFATTKRALREDLKRTSMALDSAVLEMKTINTPSLIECFNRETRQRSLTSMKREVRDRFIESVLSWLDPEILIKVWKSASP